MHQLDRTEHANLQYQRDHHPLVSASSFSSLEDYFIHLMHEKAYEFGAQSGLGKDVVDWGCNDGYGISIVSTTARSITGIDISDVAVKAARSRNPGIPIQQFDGKRAPLPDKSCDVVLSFQVIEHVVDIGSYLREIARVLRPGGTALFTTPNAAIRLSPGQAPWNPFHVREFVPGELQDTLSQVFADVSILGLFGNDEIQRTETARVTRERRRAESQRSWIRGLIPPAVRRALKVALGPRSNSNNEPAATLDKAQLDRYSLADLHYSDQQLSSALDLLAICRK